MRPSRDLPGAPRTLLALLLLALATACGGGGSGGGGGSASTADPAELVGSWTVLMDDDDGSLPLQQLGSVTRVLADATVTNLPDTDTLQFALTTPAGTFTWLGDLSGEQVVDVRSVVTLGNHRYEGGQLALDAARKTLTGTIRLVDLSGQTPVTTLTVEAHRDDPLYAFDPLVGPWEWMLERTDSLCDTPDGTQELVEIEVRHLVGERFVLRFTIPQDSLAGDETLEFLFDLERDGSEVLLSGRDGDGDVLVDSQGSRFTASGDAVQGTLEVRVLNTDEPGASICVETFAIEGLRGLPGQLFALDGTWWLPFLEDPGPTSRVRLVDAENWFLPSKVIDTIDTSAYAVPDNSFGGIAQGGVVDEDSGEILRVGPRFLVYLDPASRELRLVDLRVRRNRFGTAQVPMPVTASFPIANPSDIRVYGDLGGLAAVVTVRENGSALRIFELSEDGSYQTEWMPSGWPLLTAFHPSTGAYRGVIVRDGDELKRVRAGETQVLSTGLGTLTRYAQATDGTLFFHEPIIGEQRDRIRFVRWDTNVVRTAHVTAQPLREASVRGTELWYIEGGSIEGGSDERRLLRTFAVEGYGADPIDQVPTTNALSAKMFQLDDHVAWEVLSLDGKMTRTIRLDQAGSATVLDLGQPGLGDDLGIDEVLGDALYGRAENPFVVQSIRADGTNITTHSIGSFRGPWYGPERSLTERTGPRGVFKVEDQGFQYRVEWFSRNSPQDEQPLSEFSSVFNVPLMPRSPHFTLPEVFLSQVGQEVFLIDMRDGSNVQPVSAPGTPATSIW